MNSFAPIKDRIEYGGCLVGKEERDAILRVIDNQGMRRWTIGEESVLFEKELAKKAGVAHAVLVNSGSSALLAGISALKLPKKSKVIIPALTFPTAYSSILQAGLIPVVIDCNKETLNIDIDSMVEALRKHPDTAAVVAINIAGNVVNLPLVREYMDLFNPNMKLILDNCDGFGATINGRFAEQYADVSAISMHAAHIISMGEGGAVLTNITDVADRARKMREWGRSSGSDTITKLEGFPPDYRERYVFEEIGYNLKPLELQCAMGRIQLRKLAGFKKDRLKVHNRLTKIFSKSPYFELVKQEFQYSEPCWFAFSFHCVGIKRERVMQVFEENNIETRTIFSGNILRHPAYKNEKHIKATSLKNCDYVMENSMFIGSPPFYSKEQLDFIEKVVNSL